MSVAVMTLPPLVIVAAHHSARALRGLLVRQLKSCRREQRAA